MSGDPKLDRNCYLLSYECTTVVQGFRKWSVRFVIAILWICWLSFLVIHLRCVQREIYSQDIWLEFTY